MIFQKTKSLGLFLYFLFCPLLLSFSNPAYAEGVSELKEKLLNQFETFSDKMRNEKDAEPSVFEEFKIGDLVALTDDIWIDQLSSRQSSFSLEKKVYTFPNEPEKGSCELLSFYQLLPEGALQYDFPSPFMLMKGAKLELVNLKKDLASPWNILSQERLNRVTLTFSLIEVPELFLKVSCSASPGMGGFFVKEPLVSVSRMIFVRIEQPWRDDDLR